jgi:hypothetical protein
MKKLKYIGIMILSLALAVGFSSSAVAQQTQAPAKAPAMEKAEKVNIKGKIGYMSSGYYLKGENPPEMYLIVNQNDRVLKGLMKKGKMVSVDGHFSMGADQLVIEKIDGKTYKGTK